MVVEKIANFAVGKIFCRRWKVVRKLGAGACGAVYEVQDLNKQYKEAALKVESISAEDGGVLKLEVDALRKLSKRANTVALFDMGKRPHYSFCVMTLFDMDLMALKRSLPSGFSQGTILRIAVNGLYAIKQLHEVGYVHRDVKPGNMVIGRSGRSRKMVYLIDFGMCRAFVNVDDNGKKTLRKPRKEVLLRGTYRYISIRVHEREEQGRMDDLWSLLFSMGHLYSRLPWSGDKSEDEILRKKKSLSYDEIFKGCPPEFIAMAKAIEPLTYSQRPNYFEYYEILTNGMARLKTHFCDPYEWEKTDGSDGFETCVGLAAAEKKTGKPLLQPQLDYHLFPHTHPDNFKSDDIKI